MSLSLINKLKDIGDAIRYQLKESTKYKLEEMPDKIKSISSGSEYWVRPSEWPDLDSVDLSEYDDCGLYTFDNSDKDGSEWWGFRITSPNSKVSIKVEQGTIVNGVFITEKVFTGGVYVTGLIESAYEYPVYRVTADYPITSICINRHLDVDVAANANVVEYRMKGTNIERFPQGSNNTYRTNSYRLERIRLENITRLTSLQEFVKGCVCLEEISIDNSCDFSKITNISSAFQECTSIKNWGFLSKIDVSNVSNFTYTFTGSSFGDLSVIKDWDMSKGTDAYYFLRQCRFKKNVDFTGMKLPLNGRVSSMLSVNRNIKYLDMSSVDISNTTTCDGMLGSCDSLVDFYPPKGIHTDFAIGSSSLSRASIVRTINSLPDTTEGLKLSVGASFTKLTQDDIDLAASKGWTVQK